MAKSKLSLVINHLCVTHAPPFFLTKSLIMNKMLIHACNTNNRYTPPSQYKICGDLLKANYVVYQCDQLYKLLINVEIFGLGIFGDGTTVVKVPMINLLTCLADNLSCILDVVDCTDHVARENTKGVFFIFKQMLPHMHQIDSEKNLFDLIAFDGAANVQ